MIINNKNFKKIVKSIIENNKTEFYKYRVDDFNFQSINIKKVRNEKSYNIIVSIDELEVPLMLIRDIIYEACEQEGIIINKLMIEL